MVVVALGEPGVPVVCRVPLVPIREPVAARTAQGDGGMSVVMEWALRRLSQPLRVEDLARQAHMSPRTFARRFVDETGSTPHRWLTVQRVDAAQRRLETKRESSDETAAACGFESAMTLRHHFRRAFQTTPTAYRRRFAT
jgi:transcriptional regulator GlxA family with amidase domain